jgi:hypothetical protein
MLCEGRVGSKSRVSLCVQPGGDEDGIVCGHDQAVDDDGLTDVALLPIGLIRRASVLRYRLESLVTGTGAW